MKTVKQSNVAVAVGALVLGSLAAVATTANANPFTAVELASGYEMVAGEGKCGEGKCGEDKAKKAKEKMQEGKCGEGKCGVFQGSCPIFPFYAAA
uniref:HvfA family oxazolone/thioamide-modified RiPP metallophore n=1 Tax=Rheinheimera sp. TaxID=1869214 RepID=UPI004047D67F